MSPAGAKVPKDASYVSALFVLATLQSSSGNGNGCNNLGMHFQTGRDAKTDLAKAADLFDRACQLANPSRCDNLGFAYERGRGVPRDSEKAIQLHQKACELGFRPACKKD